MVNWDPGLRTAISDLEVEQRTVEDTLYLVDYPLESGSGAVTVATVRPETMLADTAIAVNPADERYSRLIGEAAVLPLVGRRLPILADEYVDPEFGTGALKITPGHDPNDFEIGRRHGLEEVTVIGEDGRITDAAPERFRGMEVDEARAAVVAALREQGLVSGTRPWVHDVPHSHRSGRRIEPLISLQWFCDMSELAKPASTPCATGGSASTPSSPWTGSTWTGSRTSGPGASRASSGGATSCRSGTAATRPTWATEPPEGEGWERDPDVLDTWFSSGLWPFATLGWPDDTPELRAFYPTDVLSTARDIIFLWVARMVMFGVELTGELPFTDVPIHSVIQAPDGRRMSKSLGTGIDPLDLIDGAYGADALRFGLLAMSSSQDVRFNEERVKQGRDLANKLWNASRLILQRVGDVEADAGAAETVEDRWIVSRLERLTERVTGQFDSLPLLVGRARAVRSVLVRALRLVPRAGEAAPLRGGQRARVGGAGARARARCSRCSTRSCRSPPRRSGRSCRASAGCWPSRAWPVADPRAGTRRPRRARAAYRGREALRSYRDDVGAKPGAPLRGVLAPTATATLRGPPRPPGPLRAARGRATDGDVVAEVPIPGGVVRVLPSEAFDAGEEGRRREAERERARGRDRAARAESSPTRASWSKAPARGRGGRAAQARGLPRGARTPRRA